jgi:hypothetical protein
MRQMLVKYIVVRFVQHWPSREDHNSHRSKHTLGQMIQSRQQKERREENDSRAHDRRHLGSTTDVTVDAGPSYT